MSSRRMSRSDRPFAFRISGQGVPEPVESLVIRTVYSRRLRPGQSTTDHYHPRRTEVVLVLRGSIDVTVRTRKGERLLHRHLREGQNGAFIPPGFRHSVRCSGRTPALILVLASCRRDRKIVPR